MIIIFSKKYFKVIFLVLLSTIVFSACSNSTANNEVAIEKVISDFFDFYSQGKYEEMHKLTTKEFSEIFLSDLENGIFGMKNAELLECEDVPDYLNSDENNILVFRCTLNMIPAKVSVYSDTETEATFLIEVKNINNTWKITNYFNG